MTASLALAATQLAEHGPGFGFGFGWIFLFLIPLFWFALIALVVGLGRRRWARAGTKRRTLSAPIRVTCLEWPGCFLRSTCPC